MGWLSKSLDGDRSAPDIKLFESTVDCVIVVAPLEGICFSCDSALQNSLHSGFNNTKSHIDLKT